MAISPFLVWSGVAFLSMAMGQAQPVVNPNGVVNAASFAKPSLPGGSIALGSIFSIFGNGLGPAVSVQVSAFPLRTNLGGVSVKVTQGSTSVDVIPIYVAAGQVNAIMPSTTPLGLVSLQVTYNGQKSNPAPVRVANSSFGTFSAAGGGSGPAIVFNFVSQTLQPINSLTASAYPGQIVTLYGTGLGPVSADNVAPPSATLPTPVEIWLGGKAVAASEIQYSGRTSCCAGIDQLVFRIPPEAPLGCYVPLFIRTDHAVPGNATTVAIQAPGNANCSDPFNPFGFLYQSAGKAGAILLSRLQFLAQIDTDQPASFTVDYGSASFSEEIGSQFFFNSHFAFPPPGSCAIYTGSQDLLAGGTLPGIAPTAGFLDAGASLTTSGSLGVRPLIRSANPGFYESILGSDLSGSGLPALFLNPGSFSITGTGGANVGSLQSTVTVAPVLQFAGLTGLTTIARNQDLNLTWEAPDPAVQLVAIAGSNYDVPTDSSAAFFCTALPSDRSLTVPSWVLSSLPVSRTKRHQSHGRLLIANFSYGPPTSKVSGVKAVQPISISAKGQSVLFK